AEYAVLLAHEDIHREQMRQDGWWRFVARYLFAGHWRGRYEMEAFRVDRDYYVSRGVTRQRAAETIVALVRARYFPGWWFGRAPSADAMLGWLLEDSARKAEA